MKNRQVFRARGAHEKREIAIESESQQRARSSRPVRLATHARKVKFEFNVTSPLIARHLYQYLQQKAINYQNSQKTRKIRDEKQFHKQLYHILYDM